MSSIIYAPNFLSRLRGFAIGVYDNHLPVPLAIARRIPFNPAPKFVAIASRTDDLPHFRLRRSRQFDFRQCRQHPANCRREQKMLNC